jgi:hypothetical protein
MFRAAVPQNTRRARPQVGHIVPLQIPTKGLNARDAFVSMGPQYAISLVNALVEPYGLRTRAGYTEWARGLPAATPIRTLMNYYPAIAVAATKTIFQYAIAALNFTLRRPVAQALPAAGKLFAAQGGFIYDVTAGGVGPWVAQPGVGGAGGSDFWTSCMFQNIAGAFLTACNNNGGYSYYNGAAWTTPTFGTGAGQIANVNPLLFVYVVEFKKRLWFIEKDSTRAWYLPVSQITGAATSFNFGEQFRKGGKLVALVNWSIDGGEGIDDYLVALSSQGDVVVYKGVDPDTAGDFALHGVWDVGPLPLGFRSVSMTGGDVHILSQFGVTPLGVLLNTTQAQELEMHRPSYVIAPLISRLMREFSTLPGWQIIALPAEEMFVIGVPLNAPEFGGHFLSFKQAGAGWSQLRDMPFASMLNVDSDVWAGTLDGRVVRAFDGTLDNVTIGNPGSGVPVQCQVTPAYQPCGDPGVQKLFKLVRPMFLASAKPSLTMQILTDYSALKPVLAPTLPVIPPQSKWDTALWDSGIWGDVFLQTKEWLGCHGVGFVGTVQLDYRCGGDTILPSIDFFCEQGGAM